MSTPRHCFVVGGVIGILLAIMTGQQWLDRRSRDELRFLANLSGHSLTHERKTAREMRRADCQGHAHEVGGGRDITGLNSGAAGPDFV